MNIKRGLKRISVVVSVLWIIFVCIGSYYEGSFYFRMLVPIPILWLLLYMGFWISSGFSGDDKKEGKTDE